MEYLESKEAGETSLMNPDAAYIALPSPLHPVLQRIVIEPLRDGIIIPSYAGDGDSGMDVSAPEDVYVEPGQTVKVDLGFRLEIPMHPFHDWGYRWNCDVRPRSGLSLTTGLRVANAPGTIDNFFRDEVGVILTNTGTESYHVKMGDRIAQLVVTQVIRPLEITEGIVSHEHDRGGGFGHTGV